MSVKQEQFHSFIYLVYLEIKILWREEQEATTLVETLS